MSAYNYLQIKDRNRNGERSGRDMAYGGRLLCLCALLSYALVFCSARNTIFPLSTPDQEMRMGVKERSLLVMTNDYGEATANRGHDPPSHARPSGGSVGRIG